MSNIEKELEKKVVNKEEENKQQNKKAGKMFAVVMVASVLFGAFIGFSAVNWGLDADKLTPVLANAVTNGIGIAAPFLLLALFVVTLIYVATGFSNCKKKWEAEKDTNEDVYDEVDAKLTNILSVIQIYTVVTYFLFSCAFYYALYVKGTIWFLMALVVFVLDMVLVLGYQKKVVDFVKVMNPEKQGSVYDMKFQEKWMDSCDEMEKQIIWQCGFKAYNVAQIMCVTLWTVFTCMAFFLKISLWPVAIVSLFWLVLTVTYLAEGRRLEKAMRK